MKRIRRKLNSRKGASITWALLIFLVCTVVGSAVLVAGTAAAGRLSSSKNGSFANSEQRYYAVTSTARLLTRALGEAEKLTVTRTRSVASDGTESYTIAYSPNTSILKPVVQNLKNWGGAGANLWSNSNVSSPKLPEIRLSSSTADIINVIDGVEIDKALSSIDSDGSIRIVVKNDGFSMQLTFQLMPTNPTVKDEIIPEPKSDPEPEPEPEPEPMTTVTTITETFCWKLISARVL